MGDAIVIEDVRKRFRLYDERNQSLKAAIMRGRRARYREFVALDGVSFEIAEGSTVWCGEHTQEIRDVLFDCLFTDAELVRDLLVLETGRHQVEDGRLPVSEAPAPTPPLT